MRRGAARTPGALSGQRAPEGRGASLVPLLRSGPPGRESVGLNAEPKLGARGQGWGPEPAGARSLMGPPSFSWGRGPSEGAGSSGWTHPRFVREWASDCGRARAPLLCVRAPSPVRSRSWAGATPQSGVSPAPHCGARGGRSGTFRRPPGPQPCRKPPPHPGVQDRASSPTHPRLSFPP